MTNIFITIQVILSLTSPFLFFHYISQYYYNISLWSTIRWWIQNHNNVQDANFYFIGLFFVTLFMFFSFSGFINILLLSLFGEKQELVYLGHSKQSTAVYYDINNLEKNPVSSHDFDIKYNFSFGDLYRSQIFIKDPGSTERVGTKSNRFNLISLIAVCLSVVVFSMAGAAFFNVFVYPVYLANPTDVNLPLGGAEQAFDSIIAKYNINKSWFIGTLFVLFFIWVGLLLAIPKNKLSQPISSLPIKVRAGNIIEGIPKEIKIRYIKRRRSGSTDTYDDIDSGERYITFEFNKGFSQVVYVTTLIDIKTHANQIDNIKNNITNRSPMNVTLDNDLQISLPVSSN